MDWPEPCDRCDTPTLNARRNRARLCTRCLREEDEQRERGPRDAEYDEAVSRRRL